MSIKRLTINQLLDRMLSMRPGSKIDLGTHNDYNDDLCGWHSIRRLDTSDMFNDNAPTFIIGYYSGDASTRLFTYDDEFDFDDNCDDLTAILKGEELIEDGYVWIEEPNKVPYTARVEASFIIETHVNASDDNSAMESAELVVDSISDELVDYVNKNSPGSRVVSWGISCKAVQETKHEKDKGDN